MAALAALLLDLIASEGLDVVLNYLVSAGVLPSWVIGQQASAVEHEPYLIEQYAQAVDGTVNNVAYGNAALSRQISRLNFDSAAILAAVNRTETAVSNLPVPPLSGDIASAVWSFAPTLESPIAWEHLSLLENFARNVGFLAAFPLQGDPFLTVETSWKYPPD
jgi:hypothetical protein